MHRIGKLWSNLGDFVTISVGLAPAIVFVGYVVHGVFDFLFYA